MSGAEIGDRICDSPSPKSHPSGLASRSSPLDSVQKGFEQSNRVQKLGPGRLTSLIINVQTADLAFGRSRLVSS